MKISAKAFKQLYYLKTILICDDSTYYKSISVWISTSN